MSTDVSARPEDVLRSAPPRGRRAAGTSGGWFRAFWRWHFYASFLVIPLFLMLAVTGLIYLLRFQIEPLLHPDLMRVEQSADSFLPLEEQVDAVAAAYPDADPRFVTEAAAPDESSRVTIHIPGDGSRDVFVNPYTAEVLGAVRYRDLVSTIAVRLHGDLMVGPWGDHLIEVASCWAIVMALTGYFLFFKGMRARRRRQRAKARGASLRGWHAWVGAVAGVGILGLVVTGLPWTGFWGEKVQQLATDNGSSLWGEDPGALSKPATLLDESLPHSHDTEVPWGMGKSEVPKSEPGSEENTVSVANLDTAVVVAERAGLRSPMTVILPRGDKGVYSVMGYAFDDPTAERTVHVNRYSGEVVGDYGYEQYPVPAKIVAQGIGLHEGRSLGLLNFWVTLAFCVAVIALCITGPIMWWRRRPRGARSIGAPVGRLSLKRSWPLALLLVVMSLLLPLFGVTLVAVLLLDQLLLRRVPLFREWFNVSA